MIRLIREGEVPLQVSDPRRIRGKSLVLLGAAMFLSALMPMDHSPAQMRETVGIESVGGHQQSNRLSVLNSLVRIFVRPDFAGQLGKTNFDIALERQLADKFYLLGSDEQITHDLSSYAKGFRRLQFSWDDVRSHITIEGVYDLTAISRRGDL